MFLDTETLPTVPSVLCVPYRQTAPGVQAPPLAPDHTVDEDTIQLSMTARDYARAAMRQLVECDREEDLGAKVGRLRVGLTCVLAALEKSL